MGSPVIFAGARAKLLTSRGITLANGQAIDFNGNTNYIANGDFEVDLTGWTTYDDGAVVAPIDGTGGTATIDGTLTGTTTAIHGRNSLYLRKISGANSQGQGIAYDFTIAKSDFGKSLKVSFDFRTENTWADGNVKVFIIETSTNTVITPKLNSINTPLGYGKYTGYFTASGSAYDYRLCLHVAESTSSVWYLTVDKVFVGPATELDTKVVCAKATGDPASAANGVVIAPPTLEFDTHGGYASGRYTCPFDGYYRVLGFGTYTAVSHSLFLWKNASSTSNQVGGSSWGTSSTCTSISAMSSCAAGDILDIRPNTTVDYSNLWLFFERIN